MRTGLVGLVRSVVLAVAAQRNGLVIGFLPIQLDFAIAAIAAGAALFAQMIRARIFCATNADPRGLFFANATDKWHKNVD